MAGRIAAVMVAAGGGHRAGGDLPKQYRALAGEPVIRPTLAAFLAHPRVGAVQPVIHLDDTPLFRAATGGHSTLPPVDRGATPARRGRRRCAHDLRRSPAAPLISSSSTTRRGRS